MLTRSRNMPKRCAVFPLPLELFSLTWWGLFTAHIYHCGEGARPRRALRRTEEEDQKVAREYIHKVLHRLEKGKRRPPDSGSGAPAQPHHHDNTATPSITAIINTIAASRGRGRRRNGDRDGDEHGRSYESKCGRGRPEHGRRRSSSPQNRTRARP